LSLGNNKLKLFQPVVEYLRGLDNKLEVLTMMGNPCTKEEHEYKQYAMAYMGKLKYLDYSVIDEEDRNNALEKHREEITEKDNQKN
jgi:hypothetical protein